MSLVIPSGPGTFLGLKPSIVRLTSSWLKSLSLIVLFGCSVNRLMFFVVICVVVGIVFWNKMSCYIF